MNTYTVKWEIDLETDSPEIAATEALRIQRDHGSIATFFQVAVCTGDNTEKLNYTNVDLEDLAEVSA